jgi:hypothetical protein
MAGSVQRAVAGEISAGKLRPDIWGATQKPSRKKVLPVTPDCFLSSQSKWMRFPPLSGPGLQRLRPLEVVAHFAGSLKSPGNGHVTRRALTLSSGGS